MEDRGLDITGPSEMNEWVPELNQGNIMGQCNILVYHDFLETKGFKLQELSSNSTVPDRLCWQCNSKGNSS